MTSTTRLGMAALAAALLLSACGGSGGGSTSTGDGGGTDGPGGDPVTGGTGRIIQMTEPRSLDPSQIGNSWASSPFIGNALYGQLMIDDPSTGEVQYRIAKDFVSDDGGQTFTLTLRDDVTFSDGTPLTAQDVKATWDHSKDPATASLDYPQASQIKTSTVVDDTTLKIELTTKIPKFANSILQTGLNWTTSAASIAAGKEAMESNPIGAGPYTLVKFARQDVIELKRNDTYYEAGKPYLDAIEIRTAADPDQRFNIINSGSADLSLEGQWLNLDKATKAGMQSEVLDFAGGSMLAMNNTKPPFDDVRARQAFAAAIDLTQIDDALNQGTGKLPTTLFGKNSPFYEDVPLLTKDPVKAQKLLDELAADGKPLSFTLSVFPGSGAPLGNSVQTQLSAFKNLKVEIKTIDLANYSKIFTTKDYDAITSSVTFGPEPEPRIWTGFHGTSSGNTTGVDDPELNEALDTGRLALDEAERKAAYDTVQERLVDIVPGIFFASSALGVLADATVGGVQQYGLGSVLAETLWIAK